MNAARQAIQLLKSNGIRSTDKRIALLQLLISQPKAYTLNGLEAYFQMDRVTIYRSLNMFVDAHILMKIINQHGKAMYVYHQAHHCNHQIHPHLHCKHCGKIVCLPTLPDEYLHSLNQFEIEEMPLLMKGICMQCRRNHHS
ncbi:Fur family ferric uptake transcriptional regulator [Catalinimonas alkaloidigena]|uniref:Fur family transcriptional regulator n=1 Tax=Catalinimonas alkaloidigena TaxID=1075417 RepID=UPI003B8A83C5|nr:Fur family ferric uptake transcriptional regulator [Catalinimonas alkaloidigena]